MSISEVAVLNQSLVIFGAGNLGRQIARTLQSAGNSPLAFCDNNSASWGSSIEGVIVMSPAQAVASFPDAAFVVAIWHPSKHEGLRHHVLSLKALGCKQVTTFVPVMWQFPEIFLPNFFWDLPERLLSNKDAICAARALFDENGRQVFDRQLRFRTEGDPFSLCDPEPTPQYFPPDFFRLSREECFVDCGAYDGDTLAVFVDQTGGHFQRYIALEPEPTNLVKFEATLAGDAGLRERVTAHPYAVGARREELRFLSAGDGSGVSADGELTVQSVALDELLADETPTFIKMDIEGFELEALAGAQDSIRRCRPKLAICVYHRPDHLWRIPLAIHELLPDSRMTMRSYLQDGWDTVCYCLPK
jgi:FkbM family methyltransferase